METPKADWKKIDLCGLFLEMLSGRIADMADAFTEEKNAEIKLTVEAKIKDLKHFYVMVFNVAFYEFALAYNEVQYASNKIIEDYLKDKGKEEGLFGGENGK